MIKRSWMILFVSFLFLMVSTTVFSQTFVGNMYIAGGEGAGYHTLDGAAPVTETNADSAPANGYNIAYIDAGEWLAYNANLTAGFYNVNFRVASAQAGGKIHLEIGGVDITGTQTVAVTGGWTTFVTLTVGPVEVAASGAQIVKVVFDGGPFNFNWASLSSTTESPTPSPVPTPAPTVSPLPPAVPMLHVQGNVIKDASGNTKTLHGVAAGDVHAIYKGDRKTDSTQQTAISFDDIIDKGANWNIDLWRVVIHADVNDETGHHGWNVVNNPQWFFDNIIDPAVSKVIAAGKYVIVDWHYVGVSWTDATVAAKTQEFWLGNGSWTGIAAHYANNPNVLFELFNEPGGGQWSSWKTTAGAWIDAIRAKNANNIIIVGGPNWSQVLPQNASELFSQSNIVYACHIYPAHCSPNPPNWIDFTIQNAPVMMTEWGYEASGPAPVGGTTNGYGAAYKAWANGKGASLSWVAWCFDYIYHSYMFDTNWTLLGAGNNVQPATMYFGGVDGGSHGMTAPADDSAKQNFMGEFTKTWLAELAGTTVPPTDPPTAAPTDGPTNAPTADPTAGPTQVPTNVPTADPTAVPTNVPTAVPTQAPTAAPTTPPGSCTCANGCSSLTAISTGFKKDGVVDGCFTTTTFNYFNSWNMDVVNVNGQAFTNLYKNKADVPAPIGGLYYIYLKGSFGWSHFELN